MALYYDLKVFKDVYQLILKIFANYEVLTYQSYIFKCNILIKSSEPDQ